MIGDPELRSLLFPGASSGPRRVRGNDKAPKWLCALMRRTQRVVATALACKIAQVV